MKLIKDLTEEEFDDLLFFQTPLSNLDGIDIDDKIIVFNNPFFFLINQNQLFAFMIIIQLH